jgi:hypothetical protein
VACRSASLVAYASRRRCTCSSQKVTSPWLIQFFSSSVWQVLPAGWCSSVCDFQFSSADRWRSLSWRAEHTFSLFFGCIGTVQVVSSSVLVCLFPPGIVLASRIVVVSWFADRLHGVDPFMLKVPRLVQYVFFLISPSVPMWLRV